MEKQEDKKVFNFLHLCLVERLEKQKYRKLFGLVENKVRINLSNEIEHFKKQNKKLFKSVFFKKIIKIKFKKKKRKEKKKNPPLRKTKERKNKKTKSIITKEKSKQNKKAKKKQKAPLQRKSQKSIYKKK